MGRPPRISLGGYVYHVVCRGLQPKGIFRSNDDYEEFETVLAEAVERFEPRVLSYCALPKHWHLVLTPRRDGDLSKLIAWMTVTHSARWHTHPRRASTGGLYERRFRSFPVQDDASLLEVMRFIESHPKRSGFCDSVLEWKWSSAVRRSMAASTDKTMDTIVSSPPLALPSDWLRVLDEELPNEILSKVIRSIERGCPYGDDAWIVRTAKKMALESTIRPRGRPKNPAQ
jgi:putative transposase